MSNNHPLLSIVTVCYNNPIELEATLKSIEGMPTSEIEMVVVDGSPGDDCKNIAISCDNYISKYVHECDNGIYDAMNKGISHCTGITVLMLNSGDLIVDSSELLERLRLNLDKLSSHIAYGDTIDVISGHHIKRKHISHISHDMIRKGIFPSHQSIMIPRSYYSNFRYDNNMKSSSDTSFLRKAFSDLPHLNLGITVAIFSYGGRSNSVVSARQMVELYFESIAARDLRAYEKLRLAAQLTFRYIVHSLAGPEYLSKLQAKRASRSFGKIA